MVRVMVMAEGVIASCISFRGWNCGLELRGGGSVVGRLVACVLLSGTFPLVRSTFGGRDWD